MVGTHRVSTDVGGFSSRLEESADKFKFVVSDKMRFRSFQLSFNQFLYGAKALDERVLKTTRLGHSGIGSSPPSSNFRSSS